MVKASWYAFISIKSLVGNQSETDPYPKERKTLAPYSPSLYDLAAIQIERCREGTTSILYV